MVFNMKHKTMKSWTLGLVFLYTGSLVAQETVDVTTIKPSDDELLEYNHMIFGHFIEHFHTQVYGGIFDPGSPLSDEDGFRKDVIEALKEIKTPIVRWPGGCFVSTYHWLYGVGKDRTPVYDKSWQVEDPNTFGTDEYIKWCRKVGCEPYICTNAGTGTPEEMSDWVEYCNLSIGKFGRMRMANGYKDPYNVKYWSVGNENYGSWELGAKTVGEWGPLVRESAKLMRSVTKDAKLFAAANPDPNWTLPLLKEAGWTLDYISIHGYWNMMAHENKVAPYVDCMMMTERPEKEICRTIDILDKAGYGNGKIKIAYDEWNLRSWHHPWHGDLRRGFDLEARNKNDIPSTYTMADAIFSACFLNSCLRHSDIVEIACFSPIVNTRGAIFVHKDGIVKRTTFYTMKMYANLLQDNVLPTTIESPRLQKGEQSTATVDAILTCDKERKHFVYALVNKDPEKESDVNLALADLGIKNAKTMKATILTSKSADDYNDVNNEKVVPKDITLKVKNGCVSLPPHSLVFVYADQQ